MHFNGFVGSPRDIGTTPRGTRRYYPAIGGSFEGPRLRGEVLPDGGNRLLIRPDGVLKQEVRITLKTDDDAFIYVRSTFDMSEYGTDRFSPNMVRYSIFEILQAGQHPTLAERNLGATRTPPRDRYLTPI